MAPPRSMTFPNWDQREDPPVDLMTGAGQFGLVPRPGDPFLDVMSKPLQTRSNSEGGAHV